MRKTKNSYRDYSVLTLPKKISQNGLFKCVKIYFLIIYTFDFNL